MRKCPQCNAVYEDDYVFCLTDGNSLVEDSGEQETRAAKRIDLADLNKNQLEIDSVRCTDCGLLNRSNSKFCKKCGMALTNAVQPITFPAEQDKPSVWHGETITFQPPQFQSSVPKHGQGIITADNRPLILIGIFALVTICGGLLYFSSARSDPPVTKQANVSTNTPKTYTNSPTNPTNVASSPDSRIGKTGRLLTNVHIRSAANRNAQDLGVHYSGARIRVLDVQEYPTNDDYAVWFQVEVLENGCDQVTALGCGNDLNGISGSAAMRGWMSARNIQLN